jgi:hypothetical protein
MKYAVEVGSDVIIYIPNFKEIGSAIQRFMGGGDAQTHKQNGDRTSLVLFFLNKEVG